MVPIGWWLSLGLLSWYPMICKSSQCNSSEELCSFHLQVLMVFKWFVTSSLHDRMQGMAVRRQVIIWTNARILLIGSLGTNFIGILFEILIFSFKKICLKVSSAKWRPFCLGLSVLSENYNRIVAITCEVNEAIQTIITLHTYFRFDPHLVHSP